MLEELELGTRFEDDKLIIQPEYIEEDEKLPADWRTGELLRQIGNTLSPSIRLTMDCPSNQNDGWMPLLDIKARVDERGKIIHKFYKKNISSKYCILERSAHSKKIKRETLIQEGVRRLKNCFVDTEWSLKAFILSEWSAVMKRSGYKEGYRFQMIKAAVQIYEKKIEDNRSSLIPMYRHEDWEREERDKAKDDKKEHWFRSKNRVDGVTIYEAPLILDPTFDGAMKNEIANTCKRFSVDSNLKVLVTERGGLKVSRDVRPDPLWDSGCGRLECECCESGDKGKCEKRSTGYEYNCQTCLKEGVTAVYYGETSKNIC